MERKSKIDNFLVLQEEFRKSYLQLRFFSYNAKNPYEVLSAQQLEIDVLEMEVAELKSQASLFEVEVPDLEQIAQCPAGLFDQMSSAGDHRHSQDRSLPRNMQYQHR